MAEANTIKVLIADDESIVRKGLQATVPWHKFGMEVVADAPNGRKAWEAFLEHRPQVVITDIVMPEMDGIELSRKVKNEDPNAKIILLSCHRDFEYAQQGMKIGASGYLLKTAFEDDELEGMLEKFHRELSAAQPVSPEADEAEDERLATLLYAWLSGHGGQFQGEMERRTRGDWHWNGQPAYVYLIKSSGNGTEWRELLGGEEGNGGPDGVVIPFGEHRCFWMFPQSAAESADSLLVALKSERPKLLWAKKGPLESADERLRAILSLHKEAELEKSYGVTAGDWPEPIWKAVKLLHEHPETEWTVGDVAKEVGLSRSHFSILFKRTVGDSFVAFQYKRKLKLSYGLLKDTHLTMQEIAERTGLGDSKYFSKWFKRCTGLTPSQYRARQKDGKPQTE